MDLDLRTHLFITRNSCRRMKLPPLWRALRPWHMLRPLQMRLSTQLNQRASRTLAKSAGNEEA
jgi:hypothetical protein